VTLDKARVVAFVGETLRDARRMAGEVQTPAEFLEAWKRLLPESCRDEVRLDLVSVWLRLEGVRTVLELTSWQLPFENESSAGNGSIPPVKPSSAQKASGARKWHEKFKR
jgi:hypothetical protein